MEPSRASVRRRQPFGSAAGALSASRRRAGAPPVRCRAFRRGGTGGGLRVPLGSREPLAARRPLRRARQPRAARRRRRPRNGAAARAGWARRTASTRVLAVSPGELLGSAEIGRRTRARMRWTLSPRENGTAVRLSATVLKLALSDRLLLAIGGERWLHGRFDATIARLAEHVGQQAVAPPAAPRRPPRLGAAAPGAAASCRAFLSHRSTGGATPGRKMAGSSDWTSTSTEPWSNRSDAPPEAAPTTPAPRSATVSVLWRAAGGIVNGPAAVRCSQPRTAGMRTARRTARLAYRESGRW
jgi:hypothetical protein